MWVCEMNLDVKIANDESEVAACMRLRRAVFIKEQDVAEHEEVDGHDQIYCGSRLKFWGHRFDPFRCADTCP